MVVIRAVSGRFHDYIIFSAGSVRRCRSGRNAVVRVLDIAFWRSMISCFVIFDDLTKLICLKSSSK